MAEKHGVESLTLNKSKFFIAFPGYLRSRELSYNHKLCITTNAPNSDLSQHRVWRYWRSGCLGCVVWTIHS